MLLYLRNFTEITKEMRLQIKAICLIENMNIIFSNKSAFPEFTNDNYSVFDFHFLAIFCDAK